MLDHVPDPANSSPYAFWCERATYASEDLDEPDCFVRYSVGTPELAIQRIRDEARALLDGLPEGTPRPSLGWAEGVGRVRALGALYGGRTCGFSLRHGEGWSEWVVQPHLAVGAGAEASAAVPAAEDAPCGVCVLCRREGR
ncbi:hypothetical protein BV881_26785 [Streptomyces sp. ZL-24]|uniref:hypothetical protein n=1 Tax=Streptomyces sp. ZL-24 TaxID=1933029 RepID=UPI000D4363ED|nr:hypothetical protein [Streptomyces sp. ZL-24]POG44408.1 hypothetical protein BV881_26785 [Streptomyces sp. ZL-24]